ncbi:MAG TPA: uracil phosphoribosyltransferase, partial [Burkholderiaceae bacterium]|nr:uracil phosphoribosyltransferase [Burkholderiaceae bacterium]
MRQDPRFPTLHILDHPLIQHKLSHMRDRTTSTRTF